MKMTKIALAAAAFVAVTGCQKGVGVSTQSGNDTESGFKSVMSRTKELVQKSTATATVTMPASGLIVDAMPPLVSSLGLNMSVPQIRETTFGLVEDKDFTGPMQLGKMLAASMAKISQAEMAESLIEGRKVVQEADAVEQVPFTAKLKCLELGQTDLANARTCLHDFTLRASAALWIRFAHLPANAWEVNPRGKSEAVESYFQAHMLFVEFANLIESELAGSLAKDTMRDPGEAKQKIQQALLGMPIEKLEAASQQALAIVRANRRQGLSVPAETRGPEFSAGGSYYLFDKAGGSLIKAGVPWFGAGVLSGKKIELGLVSAIETSMKKTKTTEQTESTGGSTSTKAATEIK